MHKKNRNVSITTLEDVVVIAVLAVALQPLYLNLVTSSENHIDIKILRILKQINLL